MKKIQIPINITGVRFLKDKSLSFTSTTPELSPEETTNFIEICHINLSATFTPTDFPIHDEVIVNKDLETKSQAQRIRSVLYILWKQDSEEKDFETFYRDKTEKYIEALKTRIKGDL